MLSSAFELHPPKCKRYVFCLLLLLLTYSVVLRAKEVFAQIILTSVTTLPVVDNWAQNYMM